MKNLRETISYCIFLSAVLNQPVSLKASDLTDILPLTSRIIMLRFDDGYIRHYGYHQTGESCVTYRYPLDTAGASFIESYLIYSPDDPFYSVAMHPLQVGRKSKGHDFSRKCTWTGSICDNEYISEHFIYLILPYAMQEGKKYVISTGDLAFNKTADSLIFNVGSLRSEAIHINQAGYIPGAASKFAYLSHWMGDLGPLDLDAFEGAAFRIIDQVDGETVFSGTINKRLDIQTSVQPDLPSQPVNRKYFSMSDVWECDFSLFTVPGEYVLAVEGIGCSYPFEIRDDIFREAFYHTCRQLYHNRTGIALEPAYTDWTRPRTCHPDDGIISFKYSASRWIDWDGAENGNEAIVLAAVDTSVHLIPWGWYQDAGDWDGYYSHTAIPRYLMTAFELAPDHFADGELNIPESGNDIPDILDEAVWLINYFDRTRGPEGGVAGARIHPDFEELADGIPSWEDTRNWIISGEDYVTTFTFSGLCAQYAWCLKQTGKNTLAGEYFKKAEDAFEWANTHFESGDDLYNSRLYAAAWLYKYSEVNTYQNIFKNDYTFNSGKSYASENRQWATWAYITTDHDNIDQVLKASCLNSVRSTADADIIDPALKRSFRAGFNWYFPIMVGQATTPMVMPALVMYKVTGEEKYLTASLTSCDYYLGGNPLNILWMTGYGDNPVRQVMHLDTWFSNRNEMIPGIIPYGPTYDGWLFNNGPWSSEFALERIYPDQSKWPPHETFFENRYCPPSNEFTVHQNSAPAAAIYGMLSSTWPGSWQPNQSPQVAITGPPGGSVFSPGMDINITVNTSDPDGYIRKVEYFNGWHKLGESTAIPFTFTWHVNMSAPYDISAVAVDNKGARTKASLVSGLEKSPEDLEGLSVHPAPGSNEIAIEFNLDFPAEATIEMYDTGGKLISCISYTGLVPGRQYLTLRSFKAKNKIQGSYLLRLTASSGTNLFQISRLFVIQ
jgi:hypothetical protein